MTTTRGYLASLVNPAGRTRKLWILRPFALVKEKLSIGGRSRDPSFSELNAVRVLRVPLAGSNRTTSAGLVELSKLATNVGPPAVRPETQPHSGRPNARTLPPSAGTENSRSCPSVSAVK